MASNSSKTALSSSRPTAAKPAKVSDYPNLSHAPNPPPSSKQVCDVEPLNIKVDDGPDGTVPAFLHLPRSRQDGESGKTAAILLSGAGGGVVGPSSIYLTMADKLASLSEGIPVMRLDYRYPARNKYCVRDVESAMNYLENIYSVSQFVLVGWSFGGAPVFTVGGKDKRVVGCATVASQTADTDGIGSLAPRPVLLLHGTGDKVLSPSCSERLYKMYGPSGQRSIKLFNNDNHALTENSLKAEELLCNFIMKCAGVDLDTAEQQEVISKPLIESKDKIGYMERGGDLRGAERVG